MPADPPRLLGSYAAPAVRLGQLVECAVRGEVEVVGVSAGPKLMVEVEADRADFP
jgi:hypothetical protein